MAKPKPRPTTRAATLSEQLKAIIEGRGLSAGEVGRLAEVDRRIVDRFLSGQRDITLATADRIAAALGLRLAESAGGSRRSRPIR